MEGGEGVGLVDATDEDLPGLLFEFGVGYAGLGEHNDDAGLTGGFVAALDAELLYGVVGVAQTCGVEETEGVPVDVDGVLHDVARGAFDGADDGALFADEAVEECALSYIGGSDDGYGYAVAYGVAGGVGGDEVLYVVGEPAGEGDEGGAVGEFEFFVLGEVEFEFKERGEF